MKFVEVTEIEANDDHTWDNVTIGPVTVVLALALAAQVLFGFGCADTSDDPGEDEQVEEVDGGLTRGGHVLPYKPVAKSEQALTATPDYVWTSGVVSPVQDPAWTIATGGFNKWARRTAGNPAEYRPSINASLGQTTIFTNCYQDKQAASWQPTMVCNGKAFRCPLAQANNPLAWSNGAGSPNYNMSPYQVVGRGYMWAAFVSLRFADNGVPYVECLYPTTTLGIAIQKP